MTILANCKIISATGNGLSFSAKGAVSPYPGALPQAFNDRCVLGALKNFRAVVPQLYKFTQIQK